MDSINNIVKKIRESRILHEREDYSKKSKEELVTMAQAGDQLAVEMLINSHKDFIKMMSSKYFLDSGDKEDVEQLATIAFWDAIMSWDGTGNFQAYAGMVIKRKMTDELRKDSTEKAKLQNYAQSMDAPVADDGEGGEATLGSTLASKEASPEEQYLGKSGAKELVAFMKDNLSATERDVVMMYIQGYKMSEIAEETGMKYKSAENALMRVKNKLAEYLRNRESKKMRESRSIEFTDEEKQILKSVITKVNEEVLRETAVAKMRESYEDYDESQLKKELDDIEETIEEIESELEHTDYDDRDDLLSALEDLKYKLFAMEDYLSDELYARSEELSYRISQADEIEYDNEEGPSLRDPYAEVGMRQRDFM